MVALRRRMRVVTRTSVLFMGSVFKARDLKGDLYTVIGLADDDDVRAKPHLEADFDQSVA
jgi:hypothetical protein